MAKMKDLTPKFKIPVAEKELSLQMGQVPIAISQGGLNLFSTSFKRGAGDSVFGADENGMWLGAADFDDAPFRVGMDGNIYLTTDDGSMTIDTTNKRILINDGDDDRILIGYQSGGF